MVEDDEDLRLTLSEWLDLKGYAVWSAEDGLEAMGLAASQAFDVVVTDLKMPNCDGLQLLTILKARDPHVQVIFLTGEASMNDAIEALREGRSFDFLQKPLHDFQRLENVIARAIDHRATLPRSPEGRVERVSEALAEEPALQKALQYIEAHYREPIGLREVAASTEYTPSYLTHRMRVKTGKTIQQWILDFKMGEAKHLLSSSDASVQQIASVLGYSDASYFHRQFRQATGKSPQSWREEAGRLGLARALPNADK
ncbi:Nitrogen regulation protein NR(I) [compost metagenome]